jgi:hypothetical protein
MTKIQEYKVINETNIALTNVKVKTYTRQIITPPHINIKSKTQLLSFKPQPNKNFNFIQYVIASVENTIIFFFLNTVLYSANG